MKLLCLHGPVENIFEPSIFITMAVTDDLFVGSVYFKDFYHEWNIVNIKSK